MQQINVGLAAFHLHRPNQQLSSKPCLSVTVTLKKHFDEIHKLSITILLQQLFNNHVCNKSKRKITTWKLDLVKITQTNNQQLSSKSCLSIAKHERFDEIHKLSITIPQQQMFKLSF